MNRTRRKALFHFGQVVATPGALRELQAEAVDVLDLLARHVTGDWGEVDAHDRQANDDGVKHGGRIVSVYPVPGIPDGRVWVITEADRSATTVLLPSEY